MSRWRGWFGITLCLVLTLLFVYAPQRLISRRGGENEQETELPYTVLAAVQTPGGYVSPDSRLWLITQPEQIDQVRYFALPEVITQLEQVDYRRYAVLALLAKVNTTLSLERITDHGGVLTVYVRELTAPAAPPTSSGYQLWQIPRNGAIQSLHKLVLHSAHTVTATPSPLATPTPAPQPASPSTGK